MNELECKCVFNFSVLYIIYIYYLTSITLHIPISIEKATVLIEAKRKVYGIFLGYRFNNKEKYERTEKQVADTSSPPFVINVNNANNENES